MTLPSIEPLPLLWTPKPACLDAYLTDMTRAVDPDLVAEWMKQQQKRNPSGRPPRNRYIAAEVAFMADVEGRAGFTGGERWGAESTDRPFTEWTQRAYLDPDSTLSATVMTWAEDSHRLRRQYGRRIFAELGAWPWALATRGVLPPD